MSVLLTSKQDTAANKANPAEMVDRHFGFVYCHTADNFAVKCKEIDESTSKMAARGAKVFWDTTTIRGQNLDLSALSSSHINRSLGRLVVQSSIRAIIACGFYLDIHFIHLACSFIGSVSNTAQTCATLPQVYNHDSQEK